MSATLIHRGMSMRDARRAAEHLGVAVEQIRGGEHRFTHPLLPNGVVVHSQNKETPRALFQMLRRVFEMQTQPR